MIEIKKSGRYAMVVPTSIGLRLSPASSSPVHTGGLYTLQATSAETNVASVSSYLGLPVKVLTAFVDGNPMSQLIKENLRSRGMDFEGPSLPQGGPWGYRHQINIADSGYGLRGPRVWNDRAGEVGRAMRMEDFDIERIFGEEGVKLMHLSGLIASLSPETGKFCLALAQAARRYGTAISFDLNYRASFWKGREEELRGIFSSIASEADILIGNEEDFQLCLGTEGPEAGGKDIAAKTDAFIEMMGRVRMTILFDVVKELNMSIRVREVDFEKVSTLFNTANYMLDLIGMYTAHPVLVQFLKNSHLKILTFHSTAKQRTKTVLVPENI